MNVVELLQTTARWLGERGLPSPRLDAELLLSEVLQLERIRLYTSFDRPLLTAELDAYRALVKRRARHEPVAYILGRQEFWSREFVVDRRVLIPRPDTETLVQAALDHLPDDDEPRTVLDYGTGSGCVGLTLAAERPALRVLAVDVSAEALEVTRANAEALEVSGRVGFVRSDGLSRVPARFEAKLAAIVANPPYVDEDAELMPDVKDYEPAGALFCGPDPLLHYRRLAAGGQRWLVPGGLLAVEVGYDQDAAVVALLRDAGWQDVEITPDLAGIGRVVRAARP